MLGTFLGVFLDFWVSLLGYSRIFEYHFCDIDLFRNNPEF